MPQRHSYLESIVGAGVRTIMIHDPTHKRFFLCLPPLSPIRVFLCESQTTGVLYSAGRFFTEWREQVEREIPPDRLLVFQVKEGWGPLCQFLDLPVPEEDFPNVNDTSSMLQRIRLMKRFCFFCWSLACAGLGVGGFFLSRHLDINKLVC